MKLCLFLALATIVLMPISAECAKEQTLITWVDETVPPNVTSSSAKVTAVTAIGQPWLQVEFSKAEWPNVTFRPTSGVWDWSGRAGLAVDIFNSGDKDIAVCMRVDNDGADGQKNCITGRIIAKPGISTLKLDIAQSIANPLWGMRGYPTPSGGIDKTKIIAFQVFLPKPDAPHTLLLSNIRVYGEGQDTKTAFRLPFVDRFGQYKHADWAGKLKSESDLARRRSDEEKEIKSAPQLQGRDRFGGWADGPKLTATGWFRTEKLDGKWWLVDPEGRLFFSIGSDCVRAGEATFIEKRDKWFDWLPKENDPLAEFTGYASGVHSMAEAIQGRGKTFNFYAANLKRKYGKNWKTDWVAMSYNRLRAWGFNTIANWSDGDVVANSPIPYTATAGPKGEYRKLEAGGGYWGKMTDVYDPSFTEAVENGVGPVAKAHSNNPLCIGFFVDNEMSWNAIEPGVLASPTDQPCRIEFISSLKKKYGTLEALNQAWGTNAKDWDTLKNPAKPGDAFKKDMSDFKYAFSKRYFEIVNCVIKKYAPNHLYLGCRFAWKIPEAVRACADVADVVSFNIYSRGIKSSNWTGKNDLGKPLIVGEFHFGALDRGMFHEGLVPTKNQAERAAAFKKYVESVADCPAFVGCHWFKYNDEPITGRTLDGENYNIGLVDVTDTPYPELISAAKEVNQSIYQRREKK